jgi:MerR family transcriptional regulator, light-induced transcriptional regulator
MTKNERTHLPRHPIRVVAQRTALSAEVLRAWERRYGVVEPVRSETGQRLYTDADIERLRLLRLATQSGRAIGQVADLGSSALEALVREDEDALASSWRPTSTMPPLPPTVSPHLEEAKAAVRALDGARLESTLTRTMVALSAERFLDDVVAPLLRFLGSGWAEGTLTIAHEHLASAVLRRVLGVLTGASDPSGTAPVIVTATPTRQVHEFGALLAAATAGASGWRVVYLGADLPARDIASAARQSGAHVVALSLVFPDDDPFLAEELRLVRNGIGWETELLVGGAAAADFAPLLDELGGRLVESLAAFREVLADVGQRVRSAVGPEPGRLRAVPGGRAGRRAG